MLVLAGGLPFPSDFGTFHAPNISPDAEQGIGDWTLPEFARAVTRGVSPEGLYGLSASRPAGRGELVCLYANPTRRSYPEPAA